MGVKQGTSLFSIEDLDRKLLHFLRDSYGITTSEELVEAVSFSDELEHKAVEATGNSDSFHLALKASRDLLGSEKTHKLQTDRKQFSTGALMPRSKK